MANAVLAERHGRAGERTDHAGARPSPRRVRRPVGQPSPDPRAARARGTQLRGHRRADGHEPPGRREHAVPRAQAAGRGVRGARLRRALPAGRGDHRRWRPPARAARSAQAGAARLALPALPTDCVRAGFDVPVPVRRRVAEKIAALLPLPAFIRLRRGGDDAPTALGGSGGAWMTHAPSFADAISSGWTKGAAGLAALVLAGAGVGVTTAGNKRDEGGTGYRATESRSLDGGHAAARRAATDDRQAARWRRLAQGSPRRRGRARRPRRHGERRSQRAARHGRRIRRRPARRRRRRGRLARAESGVRSAPAAAEGPAGRASGRDTPGRRGDDRAGHRRAPRCECDAARASGAGAGPGTGRAGPAGAGGRNGGRSADPLS
jgi:hypothetical protein